MRRLIFLAIVPTLLQAIQPARADEFMTPAQCKQLVSYRDQFGRQFRASASAVEARGDAQQMLDSELGELRGILQQNGGLAGDLRRSAFVIQKVCETTTHLVMGLTPEGAVIDTIADAANASREAVERAAKLFKSAYEKGEKAQGLMHGGEVREKSRFESTVDTLTSDEMRELATAVAKRYGLKHVGPVAYAVSELWKAGQSLRDATEVGRLGDEQHAMEAALGQQIDELQSSIFAYRVAVRQDLETMDAIEPIHQQIDRKLGGSCSTKPCDQAEVDARQRRQQQLDDSSKLWQQAEQQRHDRPDLRELDQRIDKLATQIRDLPKEADAKLDALAQKVADLEKECAEALDELRRGVFCSKCRRTASEIERAEHVSFETHLGQVQGQAVPASEEEIAERAAQYGDKIADAKRQLDEATQQYHDKDAALRKTLAATEHDRQTRWRAFYASVDKQEARARTMARDAEVAFRTAQQKAAQCRRSYAVAVPAPLVLAATEGGSR